MKKILLALLIAFCCFLLPNNLVCGYCFNYGTKQYQPSGSCGTQERTCCKYNSEWSPWGEDCKIPCPDKCDSGFKRDPSVRFESDGECCIPGSDCSQEACLEKGIAIGYYGLVWNGNEHGDNNNPCCSDACNVPEYENTCHCWSYAENNVCECYNYGPYYFANSADKRKLCSCDPGIYWNTYISNNKQECCSVLNGSWDGRTCRATVYEWKSITNSEMQINGYTCPSQDIIGSICNNVLTNSYYFNYPPIDNLPICSDSCTQSQEGSKCKYCEITYDRTCNGYPSGGGPGAVIKTKTCTRTEKYL